MIRNATPADIPALTAFLGAHIETSMFLMGNLAAHGVDDPAHPHGTRFFLRDDATGITAVLGQTNGGYLLCQMPGLTRQAAQDWAGVVQGRIIGMTGHADQVAAFLTALPLTPADFRLNRVDPQYALDLTALPETPVTTRMATPNDIPLLTAWYAAYMAETGTAPPGDIDVVARDRALRAVGSPDLRLLIDGGPVAMAGINAAAGDAVQVGGVFVPPDLRGAGRAGQVVTGLLAARRETGARRAILFAASVTAARAYVRIGFARIGDYRIALLTAPVTLGTTP